MKAHTAYKTFNTSERREFVRITEDVQAAVDESGVQEGMVLVSAMHITAGVWINDDEPGIQADALEWLDKIAPPSWKEPANEVAAARYRWRCFISRIASIVRARLGRAATRTRGLTTGPH